jgi:hypothetical protein
VRAFFRAFRTLTGQRDEALGSDEALAQLAEIQRELERGLEALKREQEQRESAQDARLIGSAEAPPSDRNEAA